MSKDFEVILNCSDLAEYARNFKGNGMALNLLCSWDKNKVVTAEEVWDISSRFLRFGNADTIEALADNYGCLDWCGDEFVEAMTGHIADEIIEQCCRVVLNY